MENKYLTAIIFLVLIGFANFLNSQETKEVDLSYEEFKELRKKELEEKKLKEKDQEYKDYLENS